MTLPVQITRQALRDVFKSAEWYAKKSPQSAARWHKAIIAAIDSLADRPEQYPLADEAFDSTIELRVKIHGKRRMAYRILFVIKDDAIHVLRVRHVSRDLLSPEELE